NLCVHASSTTQSYTLSLHDALPICRKPFSELAQAAEGGSAVLVNLSRYRCDALVVIGERAVTVPLPKADPGIAADKASALLTARSEEHTSELQSRENLVCRLLLEKK